MRDREDVPTIVVERDSGGAGAGAFLLGALLGAGIALLFAPKSGAETQEELNQLMEIGCEQVQGYSIAFPMPEREARDWLVLRTRSDAVVNLKRKRSA